MQQKMLTSVHAIASVLVLAAATWLAFRHWQLKNELAELKEQQATMGSGAPHLGSDPWRQRGDPMDPFYAMQKRMDEMIQSFSSGSFFNGPDRLLATAQPDIDMQEFKDRYEVVIDIPKDQDVELKTDLEENRLWISGQVQSKQSQSTAKGRFDMSNLSQFSRSFYFLEAIDPGGMRTMEGSDDITITIPKK